MQAAKEAVKDFMHPTRSPPGNTDTSKKDSTGTTNIRNAGDRDLNARNTNETLTSTQTLREGLGEKNTSSRAMGESSYRDMGDTQKTVHGRGGGGSVRMVQGEPYKNIQGDTQRTVQGNTLRTAHGSENLENIQGEIMRVTRVDENFADSYLSQNDRKSDTEVREIVNPAITKETVIEENRETTITAVDRELHQDHYQTRVQPIVDRQVLPEEHIHRQMALEYKERKHHKEEEIRRALDEERSRFQSTREVLPAKHTLEVGETVVGEHHHHHVFETIQPVVEREVIQRIVTHTTIPIHERIEKDPSFHPKTIQPVMTMQEFLRAGGTLEGRAERMDVFEGEPQVMENGGADQTHPSWDIRGHHIDTRSDTRGVSGIGGVSSATGTSGTSTNTTNRGGTGVTTTTTTTTKRKMDPPLRTASPLTASERERVMQGSIIRTNSPLASPGIHTANRSSAV